VAAIELDGRARSERGAEHTIDLCRLAVPLDPRARSEAGSRPCSGKVASLLGLQRWAGITPTYYVQDG